MQKEIYLQLFLFLYYILKIYNIEYMTFCIVY